uniref:Uncharacterized protein n=1 Tax=Rhizoctonia solani TaxID=456999 RepID=N0A755_9AGAM|nr:hypothetical protein RSOL_m01580 [Rhizoctonia solani]AGK45467.1 hypothetical protein RSOL_m01580 [Rhizoctonia solani]
MTIFCHFFLVLPQGGRTKINKGGLWKIKKLFKQVPVWGGNVDYYIYDSPTRVGLTRPTLVEELELFSLKSGNRKQIDNKSA